MTEPQGTAPSGRTAPSVVPPVPAAASSSTATTGGGAPPLQAAPTDAVLISKLTAQVKKLTEANGKYKNLLKLAKERIQQQEEDIEELQQSKNQLEDQLKHASSGSSLSNTNNTTASNAADVVSLDDALSERGDAADGGSSAILNIVRVCQRVKVPSVGTESRTKSSAGEEIWALMEIEQQSPLAQQQGLDDSSNRIMRKEWKRFDTEAQLQDFIRRDTGEPLTLPPFSLTPEQSQKVQKDAKLEVAAVTEEFRRFRVKSELARKQADSHIRDLQTAHKQSAAQRIEGGGDDPTRSIIPNDHSSSSSLPSPSLSVSLGKNGSPGRRQLVDSSQVEQMRAELASQENYWKEAYNTLMEENNALKSSGSEALLASQWRQRYEQSQQEKQSLLFQLDQLKNSDDSQNNYEAKYRDLKESFRLYRKKAKELFDTTSPPPPTPTTPGMEGDASSSSSLLLRAAMVHGSADAKLDYLRNLMVNYLTAEADVKSHMEGAIGTVLQFSTEDVARIEKKRAENESWLFY